MPSLDGEVNVDNDCGEVSWVVGHGYEKDEMGGCEGIWMVVGESDEVG